MFLTTLILFLSPYSLNDSNPQDWVDDLLRSPILFKSNPPIEPQPTLAEMEALAHFWAHHPAMKDLQSKKTNPSWPPLTKREQDQLLSYAHLYPEKLFGILWVFDYNKDAQKTIQAIYDRLLLQDPSSQSLAKIQKWLGARNTYFLEDLIQKAMNPHFDGYMKGEKALEDLIDRSWPDALPLLQKFSQSGDADIAILAKSLLFRHQAAQGKAPQKLRSFLRATVLNRGASGYARTRAFRALAAFPSKSWEAFYLTLYEDPTLKSLSIGTSPYHLPSEPIADDPEYWIPKLTQLLESRNLTVVHHALLGLAQFNLGDFRRDAILPLLGWLDDPSWATGDDKPTLRLRLIQSLDNGALPEAIPTLLQLVERETGPYLAAGARALAVYQASQAVPRLKAALHREKQETYRQEIIEAILLLNGWTPSEILHGFIAYNRAQKSPEDRELLRNAAIPAEPLEPFEIPLSLGHTFIKNGLPYEGTMDKVLEELRKKTLPIDLKIEIMNLFDHAKKRPTRRHILDRLVAGQFTVELARGILKDGFPLEKDQHARLKGITKGEGEKAGVASVLLGDAKLIEDILESGDTESVRACLAAARYQSLPLPLKTLQIMAGEERFLAEMIAYLESDPRKAAIELRHDLTENEFFVWGLRPRNSASETTYRDIDDWVLAAKQELEAETGPEEIFALLQANWFSP